MANDFRGYLQKIGASDLLAFTGNDARIDPTKAGYDIYSAPTIKAGANAVSTLNTSGARSNIQSAVDNLYKQYLGTQAGSVIQPGATYSAPAPVYAPKLDIAGLNANARKAAENAVNPFYVKTLNDYLAQEAQGKQFEQQQTDTNIKNLEDTLTQTLGQNETANTRSAQDTATNLGKIGTSEDQFQTDSGSAFDKARIEDARRLATSGLTGGLGAQASEGAQTQHNTTESRQETQFQEQKDQANLLRNRTVEDITTSNANATTSKEKGVAQAKFDLDKYMKSAAADEAAKRNELEQSRLQSVGEETKAQQGLLFTDWLSKISNPAQYLAAVNTYGGLF